MGGVRVSDKLVEELNRESHCLCDGIDDLYGRAAKALNRSNELIQSLMTAYNDMSNRYYELADVIDDAWKARNEHRSREETTECDNLEVSKCKCSQADPDFDHIEKGA
jgi:hypothetical protein